MNWKFTADRPVYQQIMEAVRGSILTGQWQPGQKVPSVRELAASAGVNPNTVQRAMTELEREGILVGGGTNGKTVTTDASVLESLRKSTLTALAIECAAKFAMFGVTPTQAAQLLLMLEKDKEDN